MVLKVPEMDFFNDWRKAGPLCTDKVQKPVKSLVVSTSLANFDA